MSVVAQARTICAPQFLDPSGDARHRLKSTLLYLLVEQQYPAFHELRADVGRTLPAYVQEEFEADLKFGRLEEGFLPALRALSRRESGPVQLLEAWLLSALWRAAHGQDGCIAGR